MSTEHLLDPELLPILQQIPAFNFTRENLDKFRRAGAAATTLGDAEAAGVRRESIRMYLACSTPRRCGKPKPLTYTFMAVVTLLGRWSARTP